jgi:CheY-like chemotaxis protein
VLVVDDEDRLAEMGVNLLVRLGYTAECTTDAAKALELVRANPSRYALVLTDQTMPSLTGLQLASQLRAIRPGLPIMLMTGYNLSLTADRVQASGIGNILHKPFSLHSLGIAVQASLLGKILPRNGTNSPY